MKSCPQCQRVFPDDAGFCPADGTPLASASMAPVAPSSDDARIGTRLCGRYELRRVVADGGMGRVYEGDRQADRHAHRREGPARRRREGRGRARALQARVRDQRAAAARHIVQVLDFQRDDGVQRVAARDGVPRRRRAPLRPQAREGAPARARSCACSRRSPSASTRRTRASFIHRDLKPDNLFLCGTREGDIVKILDFGSGEGQEQRREEAHRARHDDRQPVLHGAGAGAGARHARRARRRVRARGDRLRVHDRRRCRSPATTARRSSSRS